MGRELTRSPCLRNSHLPTAPAFIAGVSRRLRFTLSILLVMLTGCRSDGPAPFAAASEVAAGPLVDAEYDADLRARCRPPREWQPKPLERLPRSVQRVWVSPTGRTAYGVIHIRLPLPLGPDLVLWRFLAEMREVEGEGRLLSRERRGGDVHFVAESTKYRLSARLHTAGRSAWVIYASVLRDQPVDQAEFPVAQAASESTVPGTDLAGR